MFRSFSDSLRSLWQPKPHETAQTPERKRKRPANDTDLDDSDVEIVSVKKPKQADKDSTTGLLSFLTVPMNKMSEWVRKKTVRQDHFFVRPIPLDSHWHPSRSSGEQQRLRNAASNSYSATNGSFPLHYTEDADRLSRRPIHSRGGASENGVNGDVHVIDKQPGVCDLSAPSSRRSSCSSSRLGLGQRNIIQQCFQLKEREEYLKLLQQHTTVDLGYHANKTQGASARGHHSQRKPGVFLPLPSSSSSTSSSASSSLSFKSDSRQPTPHVRVTPSRFAQTPLFPSSRVGDGRAPSSANSDSFAAPPTPGRGQQAHSFQPLSRRTQRRGLQSETEPGDRAVPPAEADPDVIVVDDTRTRRNARWTPSLSFKSSEYLDEDLINKINNKYAPAERERQQQIKEAEMKKKLLEERREGRLHNLDKKLRQQMVLFDKEPEVIEELPLPEVPQEKPLPELTDAMQREINIALDGGSPSQVLAEGFRLQLTRADLHTLHGLNWLNDEVINFYMNMLMERGEMDGFSKTYAFNTFFYPKLIQGGHAAVRRWTRKVDIFSHQYLVIPVHLGVHWCLCVVFVKDKKICYYDSMGGNNTQCLNAVRQYLYDESSQKRNVQLDLSEWSAEIVKDIPQQMNGSDCGMFSCMYAESITRGADITFTQKDMPYFRRRMVFEILKKKLL